MDLSPTPVPGLGTSATQGQMLVASSDPPQGITFYHMSLPPLTCYTEPPIEIDSDTESESSQDAWPTFTEIVRMPGRELTLGQQHFEVKLVVRKAMDFIIERLLFHNGFPSLAIRAIWSRKSFIEASTSIESSVGSYAQDRYHQLSERFKSDAPYVRELSRLVRIHVI